MNPYVGIEIDGDHMVLLADTPEGLLEHSVPTGKECELAHLQREVEQFVQRLPYTPKGIGMGMPGLVVGHDKVELSHVVPALNGVTAGQFATAANLPVAFINDVKAATLAEAAYYPDRDTVAVVMIDTFIASGVVVKGNLLMGAKGWSGEFGYMVMSVDGEPKSLDLLASGYAITNQAGTDSATIRQQLEQNDAAALDIVRKAGTYLGYSLANLIHLYNPDVLVIGGSTPSYKGYMDAVMSTLEAQALPELLKCCSIEAPKVKSRSMAHGAREWIQKLAAAT